MSASQRSRTDATRPLWTHRTLNMVGASGYDARLAASPLLRNASYWRGTGTAWRDAAVGTDGGPRTSCGERLAFVTQLSGEPFVPLALCLARQLRAQGSVCPLLLVYDDVTEGRNLSRASLDLLDTVGSTRGDRLVPLSSLIARAYADPAVAWPLVPAEGPATSVPRSPSLSSDSGYQHQQLPPQPQPQHAAMQGSVPVATPVAGPLEPPPPYPGAQQPAPGPAQPPDYTPIVACGGSGPGDLAKGN